MRFPHTVRAARPLARHAALGIALGAAFVLTGPGAQAQDSTQTQPPVQSQQTSSQVNTRLLMPDYSKPQSHFPNPFAPYTQREVPDAVFLNTGRLEQQGRYGKIFLSLNDAIAAALENNLDLAIARYNLNIADTDVLRAKSGSAVRGVAAGLVQGTPGGGQGGFGTGASGAGAGGTAAGAGGAGTGASGIVQSTTGVGPGVPSFDPVLQGSLQFSQTRSPLSNTTTTGSNVIDLHNTAANFQYQQGFSPGTNLNVTFNNSRASSSALFNALNPTLNSSYRITLSQPLLNGFGVFVNTRFIRIANNNKRITDAGFRNQVISTVSQIQNIYWDLVNAFEDVRVRERSLSLAQRFLSDNRKQVEIGTLAPIEIVRAESEVATRQQELIVARTSLALQQYLIKNALSRTLPKDSPILRADIVPTDTMTIPASEGQAGVEDLVDTALRARPDLEQSNIDLDNRVINQRAAKNALLPALNAFAFYGGAGLAGSRNPLNPDPTLPPSSGGFGDAFSDLVDRSNPDKGIGVQLSIPIRNRSAQADSVRSQLEYRQAQLRNQQLKNQIGIEVRNAAYALEQNRARVEAARKGQELGIQTLDAEQKKYGLGASTNFAVLQAQRDLALAESTLVQAMSAYQKSRVELQRVTGQTLQVNGIQLENAITGNVTAPPQVPNVAPRQDLNGTPQQQQPTPQQPQ